MYCSSCGKEIPEGAKFCPECGAQSGSGAGSGGVDANTAIMFNKKSEGLALILSLILPGLGQMYVGRFARGAVMLAVSILLGIGAYVGLIAFAGAADGHSNPDSMVLGLLAFMCLMGLAYLVLWFYAMYDAYTQAKEYNQHLLDHGGQKPW
ncbi:MAG: zinc ribbon domain-containing protein [Thermoplasmata archaeon]|nr:zinc ribbon domain-containing protein [Thermoplasmata archaeon]